MFLINDEETKTAAAVVRKMTSNINDGVETKAAAVREKLTSTNENTVITNSESPSP